MGYPERLLTEGEEIVTEFRPHWRLLVIPAGWLVIAGVAVYLIYAVIPGNRTVDLVLTALVLLALIPLLVRPLINWWFTSYVLTTERLITRTGMISRSGIEIPLESISNVLFHQTVLERILKSGDLLIESAGESGQSKFNDVPKPDDFQSVLYRVREQRAKSLAREEGSAVAQGISADPADQLAKLAELHRSGVISDAEFEEKKRRLLDQI